MKRRTALAVPRLLWDREDILAWFRALPSPAPAMLLTRHDMIAAREQ